MKKIFSILAVAVAALAVVGCSKESKADDQKAELIGSWRGTVATIYVDGKPVDETEVILTFTEEKVTFKFGDQSKDYKYTCGKDSEGKKYFTLNDELNSSFFYSISGTTMNIIGGNSTMLLVFPKSLEKALL